MDGKTTTQSGISGSVLKMIAVITMVIDHLAAYLTAYRPDFFKFSFGTVAGRSITVNWIMRTIGRTAFPLFCFLVVQGFLYTRNHVRYGCALFIAALISEVPFDLVRGSAWDMGKQNVFFTLLFGYLGICCYEQFRDRLELQIPSVIALLAVAYFFRADYGVFGYGVIVLFYLIRENGIAMSLIGMIMLGWRSFPAYILIPMYNGRRGFIRGKVLKYAFYAFYPVHLLALYAVQCMLK